MKTGTEDSPTPEPVSPAMERKIRSLLERQARARKRTATLFSLVAALFAGFAALGVAVSIVTTKIGLDPLGNKAAVVSQARVDNAVIRRLGSLQEQIAEIKQSQAAISNAPIESRANARVQVLEAKLNAIEADQNKLKQAILESPEKALAVPLLRRDIDNMRESNSQNVTAIKQSVDQIYDLTKWLLGALSAGVLSLAIANFFTKK